jgi:LemA protein
MHLTKQAKITAIVLAVVLVLFLWVMGNFNSLVGARTDVEQSWSRVEVQYQRRLDLIDNLVQSTKGAQGQEREVFGKIAESRSQYNNASSSADKAQAASQIETNIALIPRLQEAYPDLKSNQQVTTLMSQLTGTENTIADVRDKYNNTTANYNRNIRSFPKNIFASWFGFKEQPYFKADVAAQKAPKVQF